MPPFLTFLSQGLVKYSLAIIFCLVWFNIHELDPTLVMWSVLGVVDHVLCYGYVFNSKVVLFHRSEESTSLVIHLNTLRPRQKGRQFPDDIFKWIFLNENVWIFIKISLKFVLGPISIIPLSEPIKASLLIHICVTRPQWVKIGVQ